MNISARVENTRNDHSVAVDTDGNRKTLEIPAKQNARGSAVNGGELLMAALATCVCNDLFREAGKRGITLESVHVEAEASFPAEGAGAEKIRYRVSISGSAGEDVLRELVRATDAVAEIQNTVRAAVPVELGDVTVIENAS